MAPHTVANTEAWRSTYLLGVALLLPIGTIVLVAYYFTRMNPFSPEAAANPWAFGIIAVAGGLSAVMAALLALFASATYRQRVRYENEYRHLQRFLNEDVAKERTRLMRNLDLVSAAQQVSMAIKQEVDFERILSVVLEQLEHFARSDTITVYTLDEFSQPVARAERRNSVDRFPPALTQDSVERSLVAEAIGGGRQVYRMDERTGEFVLAVYFSTPDGVRGVVRIARNVADEPDFHDEMESYEQAVGQLVRMVSLGLKTASIWDRAIKDEKTGLYNNNHYQDQMRRQVAIAQRTGAPLSLIMLDIDKFKHVNDTYGHLAGDTVLAQIAKLLKDEARESDTPYRYGGEELCIVCNGTTEADAALAAERLRYKIACTEFHDERGRLLPISASFGVAEFDPANMSGENDLKELCDRALYHAKDYGRNIVVVGEGPECFNTIERSGDIGNEVKRRMGLAGDNSPLEDDHDPVPAPDEKAASARAQLGESIDALATGLADVVGSDSGRAKVVDSVVREAAEFLTRNLSARLEEQGRDSEGTAKKKKATKTKNKSRERKAAVAKRPEAPPKDTGTKPKKRTPTKAKAKSRTTKKKSTKGATPKNKSAAGKKPTKKKPTKKEETYTEAEERKLKEASDRLDYLTNEEADQLSNGEAPSKRLRNAAATRRESS